MSLRKIIEISALVGLSQQMPQDNAGVMNGCEEGGIACRMQQIIATADKVVADAQEADDGSSFIPQDRAIGAPGMGLIDGYGCWCYFEDDYYKGKGAAIDPIDQYCKLLHQGYECIIMDFQNTPFACVPWEVSYNSAYAGGYHPLGLTPGHIEAECDSLNTPGTCQNAACRVEGYFLQGFFGEAIFNLGIDENHNHEKGFDPDTNCPTITHTPGPFTMECCGEFPKRFPYKNRTDNKCCGTSTYNPNMFVCCADGSVSLSAMNCP